MPVANVGEIELYYEIDGHDGDPPLMLIAGLGVQQIDWAGRILEPLVEAGHRVITYDNRDIGLSTTFDGAPGDPQKVVDALLSGQQPTLAYTLADMADDAAGLLDALGIESAHVLGLSMGGMIAQALAIAHPSRVRSLTSIMSSTGSPDVGQPSPDALAAILGGAASDDRESQIEQGLRSARVWASPGLFDEATLRASFEAAWDRAGGSQIANPGRQMCAIVASPPRDEHLAELDVPALVIHGSADTLIAPSGGEHTAELIPDAKLLMIDGMGHDLPEVFRPQIVAAVTELIQRAEPG